MKSWIVIVAGLWLSWAYMDVRSDNAVESLFLPLLFFVFFLWFVLKITWFIGPRKSNGACGDDFDFFDGGGGDC